MQIKDIISNSIYCTIGYCDEKHLQTLEQYIEQNKFLLELFDKIYICYNGDHELINKAFTIWNNCSLKQVRISGNSLPINRGHTFGTMDLDNNAIRYGMSIGKKYIWKSSTDVIFFEQILEKEIKEADFYYLNGIGYAGLEKYGPEYFFPQSNFYIISSDIDYLNNEKEVDEVYELQKANPNKRPWQLRDKFESESFLAKCVERNKLSKHHLMSEHGWVDLRRVVEYYNIIDPSHKNLIIDDVGVCHLHWPDKPSYSISELKKHF